MIEPVAWAKIAYNHSIPTITYAENIASVIDHGVGELELLLEEPIESNFLVQATFIDKSVTFTYDPGQVRGGAISTILFMMRSTTDDTQTDAGFDVIIFGRRERND